MAGSMAAALLAGYYVFCRWHWDFTTMLFWGGLITLIQFLTGLSHLRRVLKATHSAQVTPPTPDPDFPQLFADLVTAATAALKRFAR